MKLFFKAVYIITLCSFINIQSVFGEEVKLNGYKAESIVTDFGSTNENYIIYSNNQKEQVGFQHKLLYLEGELISNTDIKIFNGISYLDSITIKNELGYDVVKNGDKVQILKDNDVVMTTSDFKENGGIIYIALRKSFETVGYNVEYKGITNQKSTSINPFNVSIYLDINDNHTAFEEIEIAENNIKNICLDGLETYKENMKIRLESQDVDIKNFYYDFEYIQHSIDNISYLGDVSRYYVFDMNVYRVFYDKITGDIYFNYSMGLVTYTVVVDVNNIYLYDPLFLVG